MNKYKDKYKYKYIDKDNKKDKYILNKMKKRNIRS